MGYDPEIHHRRSIRLKGYDYATEGAYFVTLCVQGRECLLGEVAGGKVTPNGAGEMINEWWQKLPTKFPNTRLDQYSIMPNHFHGIIRIVVGADPCVRPDFESNQRVRPDFESDPNNHRGHMRQGGHGKDQGGHMGPPLRVIVQWFKTMTTNAYIRAVSTHAWTPFAGRLWQRNYYERIIRNTDELQRARKYIDDNPPRWATDM